MFHCFCFLLACYYAIVVVGSHIRRIVLVTEKTTVTQQVSYGSNDSPDRRHKEIRRSTGHCMVTNPLLRPTGIQIATTRYAALQAMVPTNVKTVHQPSLLYIESNLNRLGLLSPTNGQRSQQQRGRITGLQSVLIKKSKFHKATYCTEICKIEISRSIVAEALSR